MNPGMNNKARRSMLIRLSKRLRKMSTKDIDVLVFVLKEELKNRKNYDENNND